MNIKEKFVLDHYEITKDGKVYSPFTKKFLKFRVDKDGYFDVSLVYNKNGDRQPFRVHRLVALKYLEEIEGLDIVNHKDLNKQNNNVENLEWSNVSMNTQHGFDNCAYSKIPKVKIITLEGEELIFPNISYASRHFGYKNATTIQHWFKKSNPYSPPKGKLKGYTLYLLTEGVTTIETVTDTVISE